MTIPYSIEALFVEHEKVKEHHSKWIVLSNVFGVDKDTLRLRFKSAFGRVKDIKSSIPVEDIANEIITSLSKGSCKCLNVKYQGAKKGKYIEDAVLLLSDMHVGKKNMLLNPETGENEVTFDSKILIKEGERLVSTIYDLTQTLSPSYLFEKLNIFMLGDIIDNHLIFNGQVFQVEADVGKQIWTAVQMIIDMITEFLRMFKEIEVTGIPGNHGRMSEHAGADLPISSSFDYQLLRIVQMYFRNEKRVKVVVPESWFCIAKVRGWKYLLHHGNSVYSWQSLPYYGIVRQSKSRRTEIQYDIETIGHFHQRMEIPTSSRTYTLVNGGWIPKDSYAWRKFGVLSKPEQYFFGVSDKRPVSWQFHIDLNTEKNKIGQK